MTKEEIESGEPGDDLEEAAAVTDPPDEAGAEEGGEPPRDYEAEAREMGWVPESEWRGESKPAKFLSAEEFVERGQTVIPILRKQLDQQKSEIQRREQEFGDRLKRIEAMNAKREKALRAQYEHDIETIRSQQRAAVADGDTEAFDRLEKQREKLSRESAEAFSETDPEPQDDAQLERDWIAQNPWYQSDFKLAREANDYSQHISRVTPGLSMADNLRMTSEYMRKEHPELFGEKPRPRTPVDSGPQFGAAPKGRQEKGWEQLPAEAKEMCAADLADGLYKNKAEWAKEYWKNA